MLTTCWFPKSNLVPGSRARSLFCNLTFTNKVMNKTLTISQNRYFATLLGNSDGIVFTHDPVMMTRIWIEFHLEYVFLEGAIPTTNYKTKQSTYRCVAIRGARVRLLNYVPINFSFSKWFICINLTICTCRHCLGMSAIFSDSLTPIKSCLRWAYFTQPPLPCPDLHQPPSHFGADVINGWAPLVLYFLMRLPRLCLIKSSDLNKRNSLIGVCSLRPRCNGSFKVHHFHITALEGYSYTNPS